MKPKAMIVVLEEAASCLENKNQDLANRIRNVIAELRQTRFIIPATPQ